MSEHNLGFRKVRRVIWLVLTIFVLWGYSLQNAVGSIQYSLSLQPNTTVTAPPVILQNGTAGTSTIYTNNTSALVNVAAPVATYDFVDNNTSDADSSDDIGTHSNFENEKACDSNFDTLTEEDTGGVGETLEDFVDNEDSDMDSVSDLGVLTDFSNLTAYDSNYANFSESAGGGDIEFVNSTETIASSGDLVISVPDGVQDGDFMISFLGHSDDEPVVTLTPASGWTLQRGKTREGQGAASPPVIWIYYRVADSEPSSYTWQFDTAGARIGFCLAYRNVNAIDIDSLNSQTSTGTDAVSPDITTNNDGDWIISLVWHDDNDPPDMTSPSNSGFTARHDAQDATGGNGFGMGVGDEPRATAGSTGTRTWTLTAAEERSGIMLSINASAGTTDYNFDHEVQFTGVIDFLPTETLCIYAGTTGAEDLRVDFWNGTGWENVATDLTANSWNNYTVSLTSATFTIRFKGGNETGDTTTQDWWLIDATLLRVEGAGSKEIVVNNDTSDVDSSDDVGSLLNFANMKASDSSYANLTESSGGGGNTDWGINSTLVTETTGTWTRAMGGTSPDVSSMTLESVLIYCPATHTAQIRLAVYQGGALDNPSGAGLVYDFGQTSGSATGWIQLDSSGSPSLTANEVTWVAFREAGGFGVQYSTSSGDAGDYQSARGRYLSVAMATNPATAYEDPWLTDSGTFANYWYAIYIIYSTPTDAKLEQEVQFTTIPDEADSMPVQKLCVEAGTMGTEDLVVEWWNSTGWETLWSDLTASSWNNMSIVGNLTSSTFTIRFSDGTKTSDSSPDSWYIDAVLIYLESTGDNYELDLEIQWTNVNYTRTNEDLCIKTGTFSGSEDIMVYAWNVSTSDWHFVYNLTANSWNNVSVTDYLTSSNFTVRFLGGTETGDTTPDSWNIDATLLHVWTDQSYDYVLEVNNTAAQAWNIRLKKYDQINITRLKNCTIYFHNGDGNSSQIYIHNGTYEQQVGDWYGLAASSSDYIAITLSATNTGTSYIYVYLEILVPATSTYSQYVITFEIT